MTIIYYPDEQAKKYKHVVEEVDRRKQIMVAEGGGDITSTGLNASITYPGDWEVVDISLSFSSASNKTFSIGKQLGRQIIKNVNDRVWIAGTGLTAQEIVLSPGFYDGDELATEAQTELNANSCLQDGGLTPFVVTYTAATGLFTITPDANQVSLDIYNSNTYVRRNSTAGPVLGFTIDANLGNSISSDSPVIGLGNIIAIQAESGSGDVGIAITDSFKLNEDETIVITTGTAAMTATYKVLYRPL